MDRLAISQTDGPQCVVPKPVKYTGLGLSVASLIGVGAAAYLGKLNRTVALIAGGSCAVSALVFGLLPKGKEPEIVTPPSPPPPPPEPVTLRFEEGDTLERLIEQIEGCDNVVTLDLTGLPNTDEFQKGELLLTLANHPTLEQVLWGSAGVPLSAVPEWEGFVQGGDAPDELDAYLSRTDSVVLPELKGNCSVLQKLAERPNIKRAVLHQTDNAALRTLVREKLFKDGSLDEIETAYLHLLPKLLGITTRWHFKDASWTPEKLLKLLQACPHLTVIQSLKHTLCTEEVATLLQEKGCHVQLSGAAALAYQTRREPESARFKLAAEQVKTLKPSKDWTSAEILHLLPLLPNLTTVEIEPDAAPLFTEEVRTAIGDQELALIE